MRRDGRGPAWRGGEVGGGLLDGLGVRLALSLFGERPVEREAPQ